MTRQRGVALLVSSLAAASLLTACNSSSSSDSTDASAINVAQVTGSVAEDHWREYVTVVPDGTTSLHVRLHNLSADADLYVWEYSTANSCWSSNPGTNDDVCEFDSPGAGDWGIEVEGWDPGTTSYTLTVTLQPSDKEATLEFVDDGSWGGLPLVNRR